MRATVLKLWVCFSVLLFSNLTGRANIVSDSNVLSIAELQTRMDKQSRLIESFRIEGTVCAVESDQGIIALQDSSAGVLIQVPALDKNVRPGDWVRVTVNHCALTRSRFGIELGTAPLVNNDGHHSVISKSGAIFLETGLQPIRATWFNGRSLSALKIEYQGPGIPLRRIPNTALFRHRSGSDARSALEQGLNFAAYLGTNWFYTTPDYQNLSPVLRGVATNFDLHYATRNENAGLVFDGFIEIPTTGLYTFTLTSDDGGYLYLGNPALSCQVTVLEHQTVPAPHVFQNVNMAGISYVWTELKGEVNFVSQRKKEVELELTYKGESVQAEIASGARLSSNLLHQRIRVSGILETSPDPEGRGRPRLLVPGLDQIRMESKPYSLSRSGSAHKVLTVANEIRDLTPDESRRRLPALIRGVVIWRSPSALVLQDRTGGVYIDYFSEEWTAQPLVGDFWEMEGVTDPGNFSPVLFATRGKFLGHEGLPEPIRPTWNQLLNGSLDAEYVELGGALIEISSSKMVLLTSDGKVQIQSSDDHPLPYLPGGVSPESYLNSIVRIRGCLAAQWDGQTGLVEGGMVSISPGSVEVEEFAPRDPFNVATKRVSELLLFDPNAARLQRIRVRGQIVLARQGEYCLQDGKTGLRLRTKQRLPLHSGDLVEAVGFLHLGGPSPILLEALVRTNGRAALPPPIAIDGVELLNHSHDSTRVRVEAMLLNDRTERGEHVLELEAGAAHFTARIKSFDPMPGSLAAGSRLRLTGVYLSAADEEPSGSLDAFELGINSPGEIVILQQPPWWTIRRALAVVGLLAGILVVALVWIKLLRRTVEERTTQLQKEIVERQLVEQRRLMEQERTRVAQDLHDELGAGLTEMGLLGDLVKNPKLPPPEKQQYLSQLTNTARSLVASLDEIVWAVNPRYDSVADLASYYALFAQRFLDLAGVVCRPHIPTNFPQYPLDSKERHSLFLAFKEALNNAVRHSGAAEVRLKIEVAEGELVIMVMDNGQGFDISVGAPSGEGFQGMRRRLEQLGGSCNIRSQRGAGTEVELRLPVVKDSL